jgi:hypothetical protein
MNNIEIGVREIGPVEDSCEHFSKPWGSVKCREILEKQSLAAT